jgi:DNA polymerase III epsilon subunit-like protein
MVGQQLSHGLKPLVELLKALLRVRTTVVFGHCSEDMAGSVFGLIPVCCVRAILDNALVSARQNRPDLYISADVETDGPIPGSFSLLSFGLAAVGRYDGVHFERWEPRERTFYRELKPVAEGFEPEAMQVNGLDRERLASEGEEPSVAMTQAAEWVRSVSDGHRPVLVAYPVAFDWAFLYWYFETYAGSSPFGHSSCLDIRTQYQALAGTVFDRSGKATMPTFLRPQAPHTHNALDDAVEQGELFANLLEWAVRHRNLAAHGGSDDVPSWLEPHKLRIA